MADVWTDANIIVTKTGNTNLKNLTVFKSSKWRKSLRKQQIFAVFGEWLLSFFELIPIL